MKEILERYVQDLTKRNEYCQKEIELRKQINYQSDSELEEEIKVNKYVIELFEKFKNTAIERFDIPSKTIHLYIRYADDEIYVEFGINDNIRDELYDKFIDSYSELFIGTNHMVEGLSYNLERAPKLKLKDFYFERKERIETACYNFYWRVMEYIDELNAGTSRAMLDAIDTFYAKVLEYSKEG